MMFDTDRNGLLSFEEFLPAFILMQRGSNNSSNHWQYLKNTIPPGILSRLNQLIFAVLLLQQINQFVQSSKSDLIQQHYTQRTLQLSYIKQDDFLRFFFSYSYIWLTYILSFLFLLYIALINNQNSIKFIIIFIVIIIRRLIFTKINYTHITNEVTNTFL